MEIPHVPKQLRIIGTLPPDEHKILCVVGSRKYSRYGKEVCEKLVSGLAGYPITIVSGLAHGIDAIAHRSALVAGITTIAVPGSGLDANTLYPRTHVALAEKILSAGGCLLSEYPDHLRAAPWMFPQRNRIMVGLSHAVLVIEASHKSGTMITARLATDYNRDVLAVPGSIFSTQSEGPHALLKLGATPITSAHDILECLGFEIKDEEASILDHFPKEDRSLVQSILDGNPDDAIVERHNVSIERITILRTQIELL